MFLVCLTFLFLSKRQQPRATRTAALFPYTTLCRSAGAAARGLGPALGCNGRPGSPGLPLLRLRTPTYDPGGGVFAVLVVVPIPVPDVVKREIGRASCRERVCQYV